MSHKWKALIVWVDWLDSWELWRKNWKADTGTMQKGYLRGPGQAVIGHRLCCTHRYVWSSPESHIQTNQDGSRLFSIIYEFSNKVWNDLTVSYLKQLSRHGKCWFFFPWLTLRLTLTLTCVCYSHLRVSDVADREAASGEPRLSRCLFADARFVLMLLVYQQLFLNPGESQGSWEVPGILPQSLY